MQDEEFLAQFENCTLPKAAFRHRSHLRLAWIYLSQLPLDEAKHKLAQSIVRYATSLGAIQIYNETLTYLWVYLVYEAMNKNNAATFDAFIKKNAYLLDKDLPLHYYSASRLESEQARKQWLGPDLKQLPYFESK